MRNNGLNIYDYLKSQIRIYGSMIDVGCGKDFKNVVDFEKSCFNILEGIDKEFEKNLSILLVSYLYEYNSSREEKLNQSELNNDLFVKRHFFHGQNLLTYDYGKERYGLIICKSVLHFFCNDIKLCLIDKFHDALKKEGLLFIRLNNSEHVDNLNGKKVFKNIVLDEDKNELRYLIDEKDFTQNLKEKYFLEEIQPLENQIEGTTTILIRRITN